MKQPTFLRSRPGQGQPGLSACLPAPIRLLKLRHAWRLSRRLTHELIKAYGLPQHMNVCLCPAKWQPAAASEMTRFHTDAYVHFLQQLECNAAEVRDEAGNYVLNPSVIFTETVWLYSQAYTGGSLAAARSVRDGESDIAICWMGGQTHARRDCASGFSFVNDVVLAVLALLTPSADEPAEERRVLYLNVDAWHCSGVEEAFYTTDRVLCLSLHHHADGHFPGSGGAADGGEGAGKHHTINLPVSDGLTDDDLEEVLLPVLAAASERFCPHAIVCCAGAGVLAGDRLGCLNVSLGGHSAVLAAVKALNVPTLVLGGGGFTQLNAAKAWCHATATLCDVELPEALPEHVYLDYYLPDPTLVVPAATIENRNSPLVLAALKETALEAVGQLVQRSKPVLKPKRPVTPGDVPATGAADGSTAVPTGSDAGASADADATDAEMRPADVAADANGAKDEGVPASSAAAADGAAAAEDDAVVEDGAETGAMDVDAGGEGGGEPPAGARLAAERIEDGMVADEPAIADD